MKRLLSTLLALTMALALVSCGKSNPTPNTGSNKTENSSETADTKTEGNVHIGIVTGSVSQSEDDRRGAEAFQAQYGEDMVKLAIYPDNFTEELETTIQTIVNLSDDPQMKAIIVNQSVPGTTEAFRKIKEIRPDILCIAGEAHEDLLGDRLRCRPGVQQRLRGPRLPDHPHRPRAGLRYLRAHLLPPSSWLMRL